MAEQDYLDTSKSVMISAPAGSGKTERLSRRYIALLQAGSEVEKILAITFTEKAAAEMKERIMRILRNEDPALFERVRDRMPRMRISTIHSFCLKLLKRFCLELGMDPALEVMDGFTADVLWSESVYEALRGDGERLFYQAMREEGIRGWDRLFRLLQELHGKRPHIEFGILRGGIVSSGGDALERLLPLYCRCLDIYREKKRKRHLLDYNDLELLAYEAISHNPQWDSVLFAFDEHTDHILVDEFQDTSDLQWRIIDKLTEEWRAGQGAKKDSGVTPTLFLVGDDKQSIYSFRGANVRIFREARTRLHDWMGEEYRFIEVRENYRSLPAVVEFVNSLFERIMPRGLYDDCRIQYTPFEARREGEGMVELTLLDPAGKTKDNRRAEAHLIARKMRDLAGRYEVWDRGERRACSFGDMAILLRNRTHLALFEEALRQEGIPFVVVKGIGFYTSPEVRLLRDILFFLIDPMDDHSLFSVLRGPLFSLGYDAILRLFGERGGRSLWDCLRESGKEELRGPAERLSRWLERAEGERYSVLIEDILAETGAWRSLHEVQRLMNAKKFIRLVEDMEARGLPSLEIREKVLRASERTDEPKANVSTEGMEAVRLMTIHASKGLQFPMVFLPCLDEEGRGKSGSVVVEETEGGMVIACENDSEARKEAPLFQREKERASDEEKRLFYVAVTRSMDYLSMSAVWPGEGKRQGGKLAYLTGAFDLRSTPLPFTVTWAGAPEAKEPVAPVPQSAAFPEKKRDVVVHTGSLSDRPSTLWVDVTEEVPGEAEEVRRKHGDDWIVLGRAFHRLFEGLSAGTIRPEDMAERTGDILRNEVLSDRDLERMRDTILRGMERLGASGHLREIILPRESSFAELPFILDTGGRVYKGRIDRLILEGGRALVYDYKTYPVAEAEIPGLRERYAFQLEIYRRAAERLFSVPAEAYIFFTHDLILVPAG